jgi:hypothetical protein
MLASPWLQQMIRNIAAPSAGNLPHTCHASIACLLIKPLAAAPHVNREQQLLSKLASPRPCCVVAHVD